MTRSCRSGMAALAAALWCLAPSCSPEPTPPELPSGFALAFGEVKDEVELGESIALKLWLGLPEGWKAGDSEPSIVTPEVEGARLTARGVPRRSLVNGRELRVQDFELRWFRLGLRTLPAFVAKLGKGEETLEEVESAELDFDVASALEGGAGSAAEIPDALIEDPPPAPLWPWILGGLGLAVLAVWLRRWLAKRGLDDPGLRRGPALPPDQIALARLSELTLMLDRAEIGGERLVVEVSRVQRAWLENGLGVRSLAKTTEEFLAELHATSPLDARFHAALGTFLGNCDLVKFAAQNANLELCRSLLGSARSFVEATRAGTEPASETANE